MAGRYVVKITDYAQEQMERIFRHIAYNLQAPDTALRLLNTLETEIYSLAALPGRIALTVEEPWHSKGIHKMPVKNYIVYFWINEAVSKVVVTAVVYGRQNQLRQLEEMKLEH